MFTSNSLNELKRQQKRKKRICSKRKHTHFPNFNFFFGLLLLFKSAPLKITLIWLFHLMISEHNNHINLFTLIFCSKDEIIKYILSKMRCSNCFLDIWSTNRHTIDHFDFFPKLFQQYSLLVLHYLPCNHH